MPITWRTDHERFLLEFNQDANDSERPGELGNSGEIESFGISLIESIKTCYADLCLFFFSLSVPQVEAMGYTDAERQAMLTHIETTNYLPDAYKNLADMDAVIGDDVRAFFTTQA